MSAGNKKAIVIGAGVGGLSCAILLRRLGFSVTVVEKNRQAGGMMRSYVREGFACPVGVHYLGALEPGQVLQQVFSALGLDGRVPLARMGGNGLVDRYIFDDFSFDVGSGIEDYQARLLAAFPKQRRQIQILTEQLAAADRRMNLDTLLFSSSGATSSLDSVESMGELLGRHDFDPGLRRVLRAPSAWMGVALDDCPVPLFMMTLSSYLSSAWKLAGSGSELAAAFIDRLTELGGEINLGDSVESIQVEKRRLHGVTLASGRSLTADLVIAAVHPKTVLALLPEDAVKAPYRKRISRLEESPGCLSVQVALPAADFPARDYNIFRFHEQQGYPELVFCTLSKTRRPDWNLLTTVSPSSFEDWSSWHNTITGKRGQDYRDQKERQARHILAGLEPIFGNLTQAKILDVFTPLSLRDWVSSARGSTYGVLRSKRQLLRAALLHRTPVPGLFLAGQSVIAPGILGTTIGSFMTVAYIVGKERLQGLLTE